MYVNLYIIRHGNTQWNTQGKIQGSRDISLNPQGIKDAMILREKLLEIPIEVIFTSPLIRALKTTELINAKNIPINKCEELKEINFGLWEGMTWGEIKNIYGDYLKANTIDGYAYPPGGETYQGAKDRIIKITDYIISSNYQNIAIVSHRAVIRFMLAYLTGKTLNEINTFDLKNASVMEIKINNGEILIDTLI